MKKPREISLESLRAKQRGVELAERGEQRLCETTRGSRTAELVEPGRRDRTPSDKASLDLGRHRTLICLTRRDVLEQVVERSDTPGEEGWTSSNEISLDALDVRAIRNDQPRVTVEHLDIALEKAGQPCRRAPARRRGARPMGPS